MPRLQLLQSGDRGSCSSSRTRAYDSPSAMFVPSVSDPAASPLTGGGGKLPSFVLLIKGLACQAYLLSSHHLFVPGSWALSPRCQAMQAGHGEGTEVVGTWTLATLPWLGYSPVAQLLSPRIAAQSPIQVYYMLSAFSATSLPTFCSFQVASICLTKRANNQSNKHNSQACGA